MNMIASSREKIEIIEEDDSGEESYYGLKFKRVNSMKN